jgi:vesicle-associated membrane protein-associated protein A
VHQQKVKVAYLAAEGTIDEEEEPGMSSMMTNGDTSVGESIIFVCARAHLSPQRYETVRAPPNGTGGMPDFGGDKGEVTDHDSRPHTPDEMPAPQPAAPSPPPTKMPVPVPAPAPAALFSPIVAVVSSKDSAVSAEEHANLQTRLDEAEAELQRMRALLQSMPDPSLGPAVAPEPSVAPSQSVTEAGMRRRGRVLSDASSTAYTGPRSDVTTTTTAEDYKVEVPEGVPLPFVIAIALGVFVTTYLFF